MADTKVFSATLINGIQYEIHEAVGFSGRAELAILVQGEVIGVFDIETKRNGTIEIKPVRTKSMHIKPEEPCHSSDSSRELPITLDDVVGSLDSEE